jgi:restriction system protein
MAAPKRRKPSNPTARLESRAEAAWIRQNAKIEATEAKEKARQEEKAAREREIAAGHAEAEAVTRSLQARLTELETLLASTLGEDPYLPFESLKEPMSQARFQPPPQLAVTFPAPELDAFLPRQPSGLGALAPGRKRAYAEAVAQGRSAYEQAAAAHARDEQDRLEQ